MMPLRRTLTLALMTVFLPVAAGAADYVAKIGHLESPQQSRHVMLEKVAALVAERSGGAVEFQIFPQGQLGQQREMTEGVQLGSLEATVAPAAFLGGFNPAVSILDIPFLLPDDAAQAQSLRGGAFGQALCETFNNRGVTCIGLWPNGRKDFTSSKPLDTVEAFDDQRFRVMDSKILIEQFAALGATALALPFGELYTALQTGVVDGQENPLDTIDRMKYDEVQKYLVLSNHGAMEDVILFNPGWWNALPEEHRQTIAQAFAEVVPELIAHKQAAVETALADLAGKGMSVRDMTPEEKARMRDITWPATRDAYLALAGAEGQALIDLYEAETAKIAP